MGHLCKFNGKRQRTDSPINEPRQWRFFDNILKDEDDEKREKNIRRVEENLERPDEVWAERAEELRRMNWKMWLEKVLAILKDVSMGEDLESEGAKKVVDNISDLIQSINDQN